MSKGKNLLVFCETGASGYPEPASLEVLGLAQELAGAMKLKVAAAVIGEMASEVAAEDVSRVFAAKAPSEGSYCPEWYTAFIEKACSACDPVAVLFAHTQLGQDIAPRLAQRIGAGLVTDASGVSVEKKKLLVTKGVQGGVALASYSFKTKMQVVTVRPRVGKVPERNESKPAEVVELDVPEEAARSQWELVERIKDESEDIKLEDAEVVISGGRGMGGPEGFETLRALAKLIGAAVGSSRPPCDAGWIPSSQQVGITGRIISPQVYIAVGISGASQHLSGMADSKKIVAINKDPDAQIFRVADYGVVGDYRKVLGAFIEAIRENKG